MKTLCPHRSSSEDRFCPFYDSINMPWFSLQLFLTKENTLVATNDVDDLGDVIKGFLTSGARKS
jgi:hypothetical protein